MSRKTPPAAQEPTPDARAVASMQRDAANLRRALDDGEARYRPYHLTLDLRRRVNFPAHAT